MRYLLLGLLFCSLTSNIIAQTWNELITDVSGDGANMALLDGTKLEYQYDQDADSIWFRVSVANLNSSNLAALGVNIMFNIPGGGSTFNFWGTDNSNPYHKLLTTWVNGSHPSSYTGTIGIANASGVNVMNYTNLKSGNITITADSLNQNIVLGLKRNDLVTNEDITGDSIIVGIAAAVGSDIYWNDDIYAPSAKIKIKPPKVDVVADEATGITALDIGDKGNGEDLEVSFSNANDESTVSEYRIIVVKDSNSDSFDLPKAEALLASNYTSVAKTGNTQGTF